MGLDAATEALRWGVNDLGGTLMEESISRMAGSQHGVRLDPEDLVGAAHRAGRPAAERTTLYEIRRRYELPRWPRSGGARCSARCCATRAPRTRRSGSRPDAPAASRSRSRAPTSAAGRRSRSQGHHYALLHCTGLQPDGTAPYEVRLDGETRLAGGRQPVPAERHPHPQRPRGRADADPVRLLPRRGAARAAALAAQGRGPRRARGRLADRDRAADGRAGPRASGRTRCCCSATRSTPTRSRPTVKEFIRSAPRPRGPAVRDRRRLRGVHAALPRVVGPSRRSAGCSRPCPRR